MRRVRVAIVDDSTFIRKALTRMLGDDPRLEVVGSAGSGEELLTHFERWAPDVVTLDLDMPGIGGLATLDRITALRPTPVIILSTHSGEGAPLTIEALHRGATDFIDKQRYSLVDFEALRNVLVRKIFLVTGALQDEAAEVPPDRPPEPPPPIATPAPDPALAELPTVYDVVVVGASTGGPPTIERILRDLGSSPIPVVVVQHMPVGFTQAFAERLNAYLDLRVREAGHGQQLYRDTVYIAPAGKHLRLRREDTELYSELSDSPRDATHVPSIDVLFDSAARVVGPRAVAVLLTGMGRDGAEGMVRLKQRGAYTLAQDETTSVVFGMPRAAIELHGVTEVARLEAMGSRLKALVNARAEHPLRSLPGPPAP